jgi:hypothetical protein
LIIGGNVIPAASVASSLYKKGARNGLYYEQILCCIIIDTFFMYELSLAISISFVILKSETVGLASNRL